MAPSWWRKATGAVKDVNAKAVDLEATIDAKAPGWEQHIDARAREIEAGMKTAVATRVRHAVGSVEAAALAGAASALFLTLGAHLLARQPGVSSSSTNLDWYADSHHRFIVMLGLNLVPLGVIAFLWFMAVIRRRLGDNEDRFFATAFLGSGLAFGMLTIAAAVMAATPTLIVRFGDQPTPSQSSVALAHAMWFGLWGVGASRMVGVFIAATSTVGLRFGAFPRWLAVLGAVLGAILGITGAFAGPLDFLFPVWLVLVSLTLLVRRRDSNYGEVERVLVDPSLEAPDANPAV